MRDYFKILFKSEALENCYDLIPAIQNKLSNDYREFLSRTLNPLEIKNALFDINTFKALGSEVLNPGFFQKHWNIVTHP